MNIDYLCVIQTKVHSIGLDKTASGREFPQEKKKRGEREMKENS